MTICGCCLHGSETALSGAWHRDHIADRRTDGRPDYGISGEDEAANFGSDRFRTQGRAYKLLADIQKQGFVRVRVNGELRELSEKIELEKNKKHNIEVVVDRIVVKDDMQTRLADSLETALKLSEGRVLVDVMDQEELLFSSNLACPDADSVSRSLRRGCSLSTVRSALVRIATDLGAR